MSRFFINKNMVCGDEIILDGENAHHLAKVLRAKTGEEVLLCCEDGTEYVAKISQVTKNSVTTKIVSAKENETEPAIKVTIFQGLPKGQKMETIIQKCVEVGVFSIVPTVTERCVVKLDFEKGKGKEERWNKISLEAAKQSGRGIIPVVEEVISFKEAINKAAEFDMAIIPYEKQEESDFKGFLRGKKPGSIAVFIGPEGGFEEKEIKMAKDAGIVPMSLGKRILRTETAPISILSVLMYEYDWK